MDSSEKAYWIKGIAHPISAGRKVIHRVDSLKEALFLKSQLGNGEILEWGSGKTLSLEVRL